MKRTAFYVLFITFIFLLSCSSDKREGNAKTPKKTNNTKEIWERPSPDYQWLPIWSTDSALLVPRGSPAVVIYNGYIYALGGGALRDKKNIILSSVEYAKIEANGSLGEWKMTSVMKTRRIFADAVVVNGYIYVVGGEKGYAHEDLLDTVERAKINHDGSLGQWEIEKEELTTPRRGLVTSFYKGWIYAFGGFNGTFLSDVERSEINSDGSLSAWIYEPEESKNERYIHTGAIYKDHVYLFGGHERTEAVGTDNVEWATITSSGEITMWQELPPMPTRRVGGDTVILHENVYVVGGQNTITLSAVDRAFILPDGRLSKWIQDTPLKKSSVGVSLAAANEVIYAVGGFNNGKYLSDVYRAYYYKDMPLGIWTNDPDLIAKNREREKSLPLDAKNHFRLAMDHFMNRRFSKAVTEYKLGVKIAQEFPQPYNFMGISYQEMNMNDEAEKHFRNAINISPDFAPAHFNLGNVLREKGMLTAAEDEYKTALRLDPAYAEAKNNLALLLVDTNRCADAAYIVKDMIKADPANSTANALKIRCSL